MPRTKGRSRVCTVPGCGTRFRSFKGIELCQTHEDSRIYSAETIESWFAIDSSAKTVSKIGLPIVFSVPDSAGVITTLEAKQDYNGRKENPLDFHVIVRSSHTPAYPVPLHSFLEKYDILDNDANRSLIVDSGPKLTFLMTLQANEDYCAIPRTLPVMAILAPVSGKLGTSWGSLLTFSKKKSFILRYKEHDFAVIDPDVFAATYK